MKHAARAGLYAAILSVQISACTAFPEGTAGADGPGDLPMPTLVLPDSTSCEGILNSLDCAIITERIQIARAGGLVRRDSGRVCVSGRGLTSFCLADDAAGPIPGRRYYLGSLRSPPVHLFFVDNGAGGTTMAVGANEPKQTPVDGIPRPSPDGRYAAVAALDLASTLVNRFRIHEIRNDSLPVVFEVEPTEWGPGRPAWINGTMVRFPMVTPLTQNFRQDLVPDSVTVFLNEGNWILVPPNNQPSP